MSENNGYVKFNRCDEFDNLVVYNRNAYVLLSIIAKIVFISEFEIY